MFVDVRLLFWTDWGQTAKIEQSYLDATNRHVIVGTDLGLSVVLCSSLSDAETSLPVYHMLRSLPRAS